jgi:hypothetical protein
LASAAAPPTLYRSASNRSTTNGIGNTAHKERF